VKISEITSELVASYLRLDMSTMTGVEEAELAVIIAAAVAYVKSHTGLEDVSPKEEVVGTGDGEKTEFTLAYHPSSGQTIYIDEVAQTVTTHYTIDSETSVITFLTAPANGAEITASYSAIPSDAFEDLVIAVYILAQDMYDNRSYLVDKSSINRTVETILSLHSTNLL
jgi:hypothetical protein